MMNSATILQYAYVAVQIPTSYIAERAHIISRKPHIATKHAV